jgi:hypothetical protein
MKKLSWLFVMAIFAYACQTDDIVSMEQDAASGKINRNALYTNDATTVSASGNSVSITFDQTGEKGISHLLFQFVDCNGNALTVDNVVSATVDGANWAWTNTTGTDCKFESGAFIKLDDIEGDDRGTYVTVVFEFDTQVSSGSILVKAGTDCAPITFTTDNCDVPPPTCSEETAFGGEAAGAGNAWWFAYDTEVGGAQAIYAGQKAVEGASVEVVDDVIYITLGDNMKLQEVTCATTTNKRGVTSTKCNDEQVKVQGYDTLPSSRPAAGLFTTYKGRDVVIQGNGSRYYVIHLDAEVCE